MNWGAIVGGALGLIAVQKLTASANGPGAVSGIAGATAAVVKRFLDPKQPLWSAAVIAKAGGNPQTGASSKKGLGGAIASAGSAAGAFNDLTNPLGAAAGAVGKNIFGK